MASQRDMVTMCGGGGGTWQDARGSGEALRGTCKVSNDLFDSGLTYPHQKWSRLRELAPALPQPFC